MRGIPGKEVRHRTNARGVIERRKRGVHCIFLAGFHTFNLPANATLIYIVYIDFSLSVDFTMLKWL